MPQPKVLSHSGFLIALFFSACLPQITLAADVRVALLGGLGVSIVKVNGASESESPLAMAGAVDTTLNPQLTAGLEHARTISISPVSTGVSTSGIFFRYYLLNRPPQTPVKADDAVISYLDRRSVGTFVGLGTGLGQSSLYPKSPNDGFTNSVVVFLKLRAGFDYPIQPRWGVQSEGVFTTTLAGTGSINSIQLMTGFYFLL